MQKGNAKTTKPDKNELSVLFDNKLKLKIIAGLIPNIINQKIIEIKFIACDIVIRINESNFQLNVCLSGLDFL